MAPSSHTSKKNCAARGDVKMQADGSPDQDPTPAVPVAGKKDSLNPTDNPQEADIPVGAQPKVRPTARRDVVMLDWSDYTMVPLLTDAPDRSCCCNTFNFDFSGGICNCFRILSICTWS